MQGKIGIAHNDSGGDLTCIMAYTTYYAWCRYTASDNVVVYQLVPVLPVGTKLCTDSKGTGINTNGKYFGDGTVGNCLEKIKVRDP